MRSVVRCLSVVAATCALTLAVPDTASRAAEAPPRAGYTAATIQPGPGQVVGVGHPVIVQFTKPVADRAAAERSIDIAAPGNMTGRFSWVSDEVVQWVPDRFWPAHSTVTVQASGLSSRFETGDAVVAVASISAHTFTVSQNEEVLRVMPASMGKPKRPTPIGSFTALSKERTIKFDSRTIGIPLNDPEGYLLDGEYAVRVTWSGVYVHSAPWSVDSQGYANVSHGCINLSPSNAAWYFNLVNIGDPIIVQA
ncbi:L,D-transpeptidase [Mycobacterium eburneum]|nr:L,D-transpeptidase [Mycobacterium eburneum]TDH56381.1 L,D-transpeptidase [Mycobacterium eburneum]